MIVELLSNKFNVVDSIDLAELSSSPTAAYKFFKKVHKHAYSPDERIVVYTTQSIPNKLLEHLYKTVNFIDISNCFVLLCTKDSIAHQLESVCKDVSTDPVVFENLVLSIDDTGELQDNYHMSDIMCPIPWTNIEIRANGSFGPCCMARHADSNFGHVDKDTVTEVFYGEKMAKLRQDFINGVKNPICSGCWDKEKNGLTSIRQYNSKRLMPIFLDRLYDKPEVYNIDIKFQNTCNFKCLICGPGSSSLRAQEEAKFGNIPILPQSKWSESDSFIQQMNELLPSLSNIDFYGGEPFLNKRIVDFLQKAVDLDYAKNIRLHYNSNGSIWPEKFVDLWPYFQSVDIHFSIDAVRKQFEYQRGGSWDEVSANIYRIRDLNHQNMSICIMPSISIMNVYYIDEVIQWAEDLGVPLNRISASHVTAPFAYNLVNLTKEARDMIIEKYNNYRWAEMQNVVSMIKSHPMGDASMFCNTIARFDKIRETNFTDYHPEIAKAMGYVYNKQQ